MPPPPQTLFFNFIIILILTQIKTSSIIKASILSLFAIILYVSCFYFAKTNYLGKIFLMLSLILKKFKTNYIINTIFCISIFMFIFQIFPFVFQGLKVMNEFIDIPEQTIIEDKIISNIDYEMSSKFKDYTEIKKEESEITQYNKINNFEIHWKTLSRWALYHHSHMLIPMLELELGKDRTQIFSQYSLFNTNLLRYALKYTGGINIQTYFKLYYSFYYLYYGLLIFFAYKIFRSKNYTLALLLSIIISINIYNFYYFYLAPGCNPMRHCLDIIVIFLLYKYYTNYKIKYFVSSVILSLLATLLNANMGLFLYLAALPTFWYKNIIVGERKNYLSEIIVLVCSLFILPFIYHTSTIGIDYTKEYFIAGMLGWHLPTALMYKIFAAIMACYIFFTVIKVYNKFSNLKFIAFFSFIYVQGLLLYFVWGSDTKHFMVIMPVISFMFLMIFKLIIDTYLNNKFLNYRNIITNISIGCLFIIACIGFSKYVDDYQSYCNIFKHHITYNWNLKNAKFTSTMNPAYFTDSIDLIKKYSKNQNGIYIISKYDYFVPFLADKYSLMPYINLEWYLESDKEVNKTINLIKTEKPEILFTDKNIMYRNNKCYSNYNRNFSYLNLECQAHKDRIHKLENIFNSVITDYEAIDSSYLLTVYRRKK